MDIVRYSRDKKNEWNAFLKNSKNGLFLFDRDYIEYHSDRFIDFSLMFYNKDELIALLPANIADNVLVSHGGLTFGGFITDLEMKTSSMLILFDELKDYLKTRLIDKMIYKCVPHIYHTIPSDEDRYALFRNGATLFRRDITSTVYLREKSEFQKIRRRRIKKAELDNLYVKKIDDFGSYWRILEENLSNTHNTKPVHTLEEIENLHSKFPDNIKLFASFQDDSMKAGVVVYESTNVAHVQYIANSEDSKDTGSLDLIFAYLINEYCKNKKYFDFGISTENGGLFLNEGLIFFKEGFGARGIVHDFYEVKI